MLRGKMVICENSESALIMVLLCEALGFLGRLFGIEEPKP